MVLSAVGRSVANIGVVARSRPESRGGGPLAMAMRIQDHFDELERATGLGMLNTFGSQTRLDQLQRALDNFRREKRLTEEAALRMVRQDAQVRQGIAAAAVFRGGNVRVFGEGGLVDKLKTASALQAFLSANRDVLSQADRRNLEKAIDQAKDRAKQPASFKPFAGTDFNIRDNVFEAARKGRFKTVADIKSAASNIQNASFRGKVIAKARRISDL
ncbi:MAG: hypothetical protein ACREJ0_14690 [Geminicoccaceae bacterium]